MRGRKEDRNYLLRYSFDSSLFLGSGCFDDPSDSISLESDLAS